MRKYSRLIAVLLAFAMVLSLVPATFAAETAETAETAIPIFEDTSYSFAERAADLVARMNVAQKASQMINQTPAISASALGGGALNVPATKGISGYRWWMETLHGCGSGVNYPQNTTVASTWNPDLYRQESTNIGQEIRERNNTNLNYYSPTVNLHRDPRWGRNEESYSEDVFLSTAFGTAWVLGIEQKDDNGVPLDPDGYYNLHCTIKHYVANNNEGKSSGDTTGRLRAGAMSSLRMLREYYAQVYGDIIRNTDVSSVMTAYSYYNTVSSSYSSYLMDTLLRQVYGFDGHITSDCDSVASMQNLNYINPYTGKVLTAVEALSGALAHGEDLECNGGHSSNGSGTSGFHTDYNAQINNMIDQAVRTDKGIFTENSVDISVHRLMTARIETGEFDGNIKLKQDAAARQQNATALRAERKALVRQINAEGVVMLQNKGMLPLDASCGSVVIVGAWQTNGSTGLYAQASRNETTIQAGLREGLTAMNPNIKITTITSNSLTDANKADIAAADAVIVVTGTSSSYSQEDHDRATIALPDGQDTLASTVGKLNPNTVVIMETCGPMQVTTFQNDVNAILWSSFGGQWKTGQADIITGVANPSGKVTDTWYQNVSDTGVSDVPAITDYDMLPSEGKNGRTYMYYNGANEPSYPFGFGLSYTTFEYSNLKIDKTSYDANETVKVSFDVKNTGKVAGKEATQLYIAQPNAPAELQRPIKRLEGFEKIELQPGETKTVSMEVAIPDLVYFDEALDCMVVDTGAYQVQVGTNSKAAADLTTNFTVSGALKEVPAVVTVKANQGNDSANGIEERLIYGKGQTVNAQVTVAMNNEKLYGYIIADSHDPIKAMKSCDLPEGAVVTYSSNRPEVLKVEGDKITTAGPGVATLTVSVTYNGVTETGESVIYVMTNTDVDEITVDGEPIAKFSPKRYSYSMKLENKKHIPVIEASFSNPDLDVVVTQAEALPGVATVVATDRDSGISSTYTIAFKVKVDGSGYMLADTIEAGKQYVIVSNGYALTNEVAEVSTAYGKTSLASTPVEVDNDMIVSDVLPEMIWDFNEGTSTSNNGFTEGFWLTSGDSKLLARNGPTNGNPAPLNTSTYDENNYTSKPQFCYWVVKDLDDEGNKAVFCTGTGEWSFALRGAADGFDAPGNASANTVAAANPCQLYEVVSVALPSIDFTNPDDATKFDVVGEKNAAIVEGEGLTLTATKFAFEDCKGQLSGDAAVTPEDCIVVPVTGDWEATLEFVFSTGSARNGYYQFFGFYASEGDDFQNMVGVRGGDGAMQNFTRFDGAITADSSDLNSAPGLSNNGATYWYKIVKEGTTYTVSRSSDGEDFTDMFKYEDTDVDADSIVIDAYTGMTEGYQFTLKSLTFEGGAPAVKEKPAIAEILVNGASISFDPAVKAYNIEVARDASEAPVVEAVAGNKSTVVTVEQIDTVTGTAKVTATVDTKSVTYTVSFGYGPANDYFADGDFDADIWNVLNEDATTMKVEAGKGIVLPTQTANVYQSGSGWKNCFTSSAMGNWEVVAKVHLPIATTANYQQATMMLWQDEDNYVRMNLQHMTSRMVVEPGQETDGTFKAGTTVDIPAAEDGSVTIFLKLKKDNDLVTGAYSLDGSDFVNAYSVEGVNYTNPQIALFSSMNQDGEQIDTYYEYVYVVAREGLQPDYTAMLDWAAQNVADYVAAALPETASEDLVLAPAPHGYAVTLESSDPAVIAADGTVTPAAEDKTVTVTVTAVEGSVSANAQATVTVPGTGSTEQPALAIVTEPVDYTGSIGSTASFTVAVNRTDVTYQWMWSKDGGKTWNVSDQDGFATETVNVQLKAFRNGQMYKVVVTDSTGATVESAAVKMSTPTAGLKIVENPANVKVAVNQAATFTVKAEGEGLTYQWMYSNNSGSYWSVSTADGATTASMSIAGKTFRNGQMYKCVVTDASGNVVESAPATMTVG